MALGIIAFVVIPLLGLMSIGFTTMKNSNADVRSAIIAQKIIGEAQMIPYDQLRDNIYFIDFEGKEVAEQQAVFQAQLNVSKAPAGDIISSPNAARVSVAISGDALQNQERVYSTTVFNLGH